MDIERRDQVVWDLCENWRNSSNKGIPSLLVALLEDAYESGFEDAELNRNA